MNTLKQTLFLLLILVFSGVSKTIAQSTGVYVGGHIRRERPGTIEKLRNSGFTYIILFNINVEPDGTLTTDGETVCKDGKYVFGNTQPNYVSDIKKLKQAPTTISRIEICIGGWGNESFRRIKELINSHGVGSGTILYKNFKALKNAIPEIDAVNNDDEHCYDVATAVKFHQMMYELGYKTTIAPYTNRSFWENLVSQLGDRCDRVLIQCYEGGAGNNPSDWHLGNRAVHAGRMNYQEGGVDACVAQMESWKRNNGVSGGFIWLYNDETWNLNQWATRMLRVFGTKKCDDNIASLYADSDYRGYSKSLGEGSYTQADLAMYGISAKDVSSLKVTKGFKITLYENADFTGNSKSWTTDASFVGGDWNDKACSVRIEPNGKSGLSGNFKIMNRNSGKYLDLDNNKTDNNTAIVQFDDEGVDASQTWTFTEVMKGKGVYSICSYGNKNRGMDVLNSSKDNGAQVQLYDYLGNPHQQFILYDCGEGYYQLVARNSGKVVEIPQSSKGNGEWIKIYDNNGTHTQQWAVVENRCNEAPAVILYTDRDYKGKAVTLSEGKYNLSQMGLYNLTDNDMSSLKVTPGFKVTIYEDDNFNGKSKSYTASESFVGEDWNDKMSSLKVEAYHELQVTYQIGDATPVVNSGTEGSLATLLKDEDNAMKVTQLSVNGYLNKADIGLLQKMAGKEGKGGSLKSLDLSEATFTETGKKVPDNIFQNCKNLQKVDLSNMTEIGQWAFQNCALTEISIPATVTRIEKGAFAGNSAVTKVIVHSGSQIDARSYDGENNIFSGMDPNKVQVVFEGAAEYNYKNYRNDIQVGNNGYKNAFMDLLTKTLDENDEDYTVVAQRHADVLLKRTFKEGWNTLVLPFGARYLKDDSEPSCSSIFQRALNASNTEGFMIAAYRGLAKNEAQPDNSTFYFLKYANYNEDPLDEFEPLLIRMTQKDINDAKGVYIFKNVELNFDGDFKDPNNDKIKIYKEYTAAEAKERMGKKEHGEYFDGSYDTNANDKFTKCSYDDFYFTGTLYKQDTDKKPAFIAPGDYIIQNNTFVKCLSGKKYGLKGFRGYFKQKPSASFAKGNIGICLVDRNGVVSSIHQVDGVSLTSASVAPVAVYNLSGQQVGNSLSTLAKGVYIIKGKKFVKK